MPFRTHYTTRHGLKAKLTAMLILYLNAYLLHEYRFNIGVSGDRETSRLRVLQVAVNGIHVSSCLFSSDIPSLPFSLSIHLSPARAFALPRSLDLRRNFRNELLSHVHPVAKFIR